MDRGVLKTVVSGLIMLIFTAVYYLYNPWLSLFAVVVVLILYFRYEGKNYSTVEEGLFCNTMKLFVVFAAVIAAARFINITGYPIDFYTDEWNEISGAYFRLSGDREFLAYNSRFGSSLLYFSLGVITAVMALFRENLDMLRLIPAVVSVLTALAFYFLGAVLKNKKLGVVWAFLFLSSCWALFLSRKLMENIYIPFFAVLVLVLFFAYIRTGRFLMLAAAGVLWFLALYTYSSWLLSIPMAVYLCFEYRKELGHKKLVGTAIFMVAALVLYSLAPGGAGETQEWALRNTVFQKGGQVLAVFVNIKNIFIYLFTPFEYTHLSHTLPAVSASGALLLAGGIAEAVRSRDNRTSRFFLFGLLISMATLVICEDPAHNLRHVMMLPFIVMLSGIFLNRMLRWKYLYVFIALHICLFSGSLFYHLTVWGTQMNISGKEMAVSAHINSICKDDYIYMHEGIIYGHLSSYLRTKQAYKRIDKPEGAYLLSTRFARQHIREVFPQSESTYFYDDTEGIRYTLVFHEIPFNNDERTRRFFIELANDCREINMALWENDFAKAAERADSLLSRDNGDSFLILRNTIIRYLQFEALSRIGKSAAIIEALADNERRMFQTADFIFFLGQDAFNLRDYKSAAHFFERAQRKEPGWDAPRRMLIMMRKHGLI